MSYDADSEQARLRSLKVWGGTGLPRLDSTLSLMDRAVNIIGMEGRMDWEDLMEWQRCILGGDPTPEAAPPAPPGPTFRTAPLPDPQHGGGRIWGAPEGDE